MNEHLSGAERRSEPSPGETPEFDAMTWGAEQALKSMMEYQVESLRFLARRTYCNLEFLRHLRHCAGWQDMAQVQQSWFKECVADYGEEVARLAGTGFQFDPKRLRTSPIAHVSSSAPRRGPMTAPVDRFGPRSVPPTSPR
jgi:hypothetical protein